MPFSLSTKTSFVLILCISIVTGGVLGSAYLKTASDTSSQTKLDQYNQQLAKTINVTGRAEKIVTSDSAKLSITIVEKASKGKAIEAVIKRAQDIETLAKKEGLTDAVVSHHAPLLGNVYDYGYDGYGYNNTSNSSSSQNETATQVLVIESHMVKKVGDINRSIIKYLTEQGQTYRDNTVQYFISDEHTLMQDLSKEAMQQANELAESIAPHSIKGLYSVQAPLLSVGPVNEARRAYNYYDSYEDQTSVEKRVVVTISVFFELK
jgi:uncharacterized protein YggE